MKKTIGKTIVKALAWTLILGFACSCSGKKTVPGAETVGKKIVLCSFYPVYIMSRNITRGVPGLELKNLTPFATGCLHDYSLTPADRLALDKASLFIVNGYGMENFLDKLVSQNPGLKIVFASAGIEPMVDHKTGQTNAHLWVSVGNAIRQVYNIGEGLASFDPKNADIYRWNARQYIRDLEILRAKMLTLLKPAKNSSIVTFHEAFPYFAGEFGLNIAAVVEREPGSEPSAREMADTVRLIKKIHIKAIFAEPQYSPKAADTIGKETGVPVRYLDPAVTGPDRDDAYIRIMENNLTVLQEALK